MSYLGNTPTTQSFISGTDYFNGTGAQTAFTLSRTVASVNDIEAVVNNVVQQPNDAYTISGTTITFTSAPSSGTNNVYVRYLSTTTQAITPSQNTVSWNTLDTNTQQDLGISFKNRIINSNMVIDQRNAGASVTITGTNATDYILDRWFARAISATGSKISVQRSSVAPDGFTNSQLITSLSAYSIGANETFGIMQHIEGFNTADLGWGTANAKTVTLSFWVRSSLTGTFGGFFTNGAGNRWYIFSYTINSANTWEKKSITITGDTTGTWSTDNNIGITISFSVGAGSSLTTTAGSWGTTLYRSVTGQVNVTGTNGATWYITGVQLEVGTQATTFTTAGGSYGAELALCQRYYEKTYNIDVAPATNTSAGIYDLSGSSDSGGNLIIRVNFAVSKRANPTVTLYTAAGSSGSWNYNRNGASGTGAGTVDNIGMSGVRVYIAIGANWVVGGVGGHWIASAEL
jgi:hypothetical protein